MSSSAFRRTDSDEAVAAIRTISAAAQTTPPHMWPTAWSNAVSQRCPARARPIGTAAERSAARGVKMVALASAPIDGRLTIAATNPSLCISFACSDVGID
jgi:hypothetical protein